MTIDAKAARAVGHSISGKLQRLPVRVVSDVADHKHAHRLGCRVYVDYEVRVEVKVVARLNGDPPLGRVITIRSTEFRRQCFSKTVVGFP